jgi:hypothetical protein
MLTTIQFDNQCRLDTHKVRDVRRNWMLAPELVSLEQAVFKMPPKQSFGVG